MTPMRYSIIIPHKNRLPLLKKLLDSIPQKKHLEVIIVDDASDNDIRAGLDEIVKNRLDIKLFRNTSKISRGAGWARNRGLEKAMGEYILFADSDDSFSTNAFDFIDKELEDSTSDFIVFKTESMDEKGSKSDRTNYYNYLLDQAKFLSVESDISESLLVKKILLRIDPPWAKLFKRSFLEEYDIKFEEIHFSNDVFFNTSVILKAENIILSKSVIYTVLDHNESLVNILSEQSFDQRFNACLKFNKMIQKNSLFQNAYSITGGYLWKAKVFGTKKVVETFKEARKEKVPFLYPVHRYLISFVMRIFGANKERVRFYLVFGRF